MPGFAPLGSVPVASLPNLGSTHNVFNIPSNFFYQAVNCYSNPRSNAPGNYTYQALTGGNIITPTGPRHVTWFGAEILHDGRGDLHVSWMGLEILHDGFGFEHVSWIGAEILHDGFGYERISNICVEILRSIRAQDDAEVTHVY